MRKYRFIFSFIIITLIFSFYTFPCFAEDTAYVWSPSGGLSPTSSTLNFSDNGETNNNNLNLESEGAILIEQSTGQVLYSQNPHEQLRPASVTKVMSILLIMEALESNKISLSDQVPCSENAASMGGSQIWLAPRETLSVDDMLKAICVNSAND